MYFGVHTIQLYHLLKTKSNLHTNEIDVLINFYLKNQIFADYLK